MSFNELITNISNHLHNNNYKLTIIIKLITSLIQFL